MSVLNLYDKVLATTLTSLNLHYNEHKKMTLSNFNPKSTVHLYFFEAGLQIAEIRSGKIGLNMSIFSYIKFKLKNWKVRKSFKWAPFDKNDVNISLFKENIQNTLNVSSIIFRNIYFEYFAEEASKRRIFYEDSNY